VSLLDQLHVHLPAALSNAPFGTPSGRESFEIVTTGAIINVPAMLIVGLIATICYIGIKQSAAFNSVIVAIKVTVIMLFILFGVSYINPANLHPFIPPNTGQTGVFGWSGVMAASGVIFFAYIGFDAVSTAAQETKNPQRDMPIGILASLVICTILYVVVSAVLTGMVHYTELDVAAPVALALDKYPPLHWLGIPVKLGAVCGMTSVMLVMTIAQARIFFAMARGAVAAVVRTRAPALPHALDRHRGDRNRGRHRRRAVPGENPRRAGVDRHAGRLRDGVHRRVDPAPLTARPAAPVPHPVALVRVHRRRRRVRRDDDLARTCHLDAAGGLDRHRRADLCLLWLPAQLPAQGCQRRPGEPAHRLSAATAAAAAAC